MSSLEKNRRISAESRAFGLKITERKKIFDAAPDLDLAWVVRFSVPFSYAASKNSSHGRAGVGSKARVFLRTEARQYRDAITLATKVAIRDTKIKQNKLWIDLFVEKPNHRGDAINVVDLVCDGIKKAVPIDDRWFSIRYLDWSVNRNDPRLFIGLAQEFGEDSKVCELCGRIRPLTEFTISRTVKSGRAGDCQSCRLRDGVGVRIKPAGLE